VIKDDKQGHMGKKKRSLLGSERVKMDLKEWDGRLLTGFIWLRIGTSGSILRIQYSLFGFHKMMEII
jgi:hypothetical protein